MNWSVGWLCSVENSVGVSPFYDQYVGMAPFCAITNRVSLLLYTSQWEWLHSVNWLMEVAVASFCGLVTGPNYNL